MGIKKIIEKYSFRIVLSLLLVIFVSVGISISMYQNYVLNNKIENVKFDPFNILKRVQELEISYATYTKTSALQMKKMWLDLFHKATYKSGGNPNFNEYDCLSAPYKFWEYFGANIKLESIPQMRTRLENLDARVRNLDEINTGDIIIFKPMRRKGRDVWHLAVVSEVIGPRILYMDINAGTQTWGFQHTWIQNKRISGIYNINLGFWIGDFFRDVKKR
jgi:hypothetical protein